MKASLTFVFDGRCNTCPLCNNDCRCQVTLDEYDENEAKEVEDVNTRPSWCPLIIEND